VDSVRVTAVARDANGKPLEGHTTARAISSGSVYEYAFALEPGSWFVFANTGIDSHHRFTQATEFAMDITLVDATGSRYRRNGRLWKDNHAYNKKVLAAADDQFVRIVNDSHMDPKAMSPQPGELDGDFWRRVERRQLTRFMEPGADPLEVAGGNHIIIKHTHGEFSYYAHLAEGSIRVIVGDQVKEGQHIAGVGGTGEHPEVHLHFQVIDDAEDVAARSIPVRFKNLEWAGYESPRSAARFVRRQD
jgi:hypothetical protein